VQEPRARPGKSSATDAASVEAAAPFPSLEDVLREEIRAAGPDALAELVLGLARGLATHRDLPSSFESLDEILGRLGSFGFSAASTPASSQPRRPMNYGAEALVWSDEVRAAVARGDAVEAARAMHLATMYAVFAAFAERSEPDALYGRRVFAERRRGANEANKARSERREERYAELRAREAELRRSGVHSASAIARTLGVSRSTLLRAARAHIASRR